MCVLFSGTWSIWPKNTWRSIMCEIGFVSLRLTRIATYMSCGILTLVRMKLRKKSRLWRFCLEFNFNKATHQLKDLLNCEYSHLFILFAITNLFTVLCTLFVGFCWFFWSYGLMILGFFKLDSFGLGFIMFLICLMDEWIYFEGLNSTRKYQEGLGVKILRKRWSLEVHTIFMDHTTSYE